MLALMVFAVLLGLLHMNAMTVASFLGMLFGTVALGRVWFQCLQQSSKNQ